MNTLEEIASQVKVCTKCRLHEGRTNAVPGTGSTTAEILFIGEGPGKDEDIKGEPFVGRAGKLLTTMLQKIGIERESVFITNVVKCRPPENRDPMDDEIEICWPYLEAQIKILNPKVIVTLGRHSLKRFLPGFSISAAHGEPKRRQSDGRIIFPMYHPAVALYKASSLAILEKDFIKLSEMLTKMREGTIQHITKEDPTLQQFSTEVKPNKDKQNLSLF
jgi:DNA polymerase